VSLYPLYFERQRTQALTNAQIAQYLRESLVDQEDNVVYNSRIRNLRRGFDQITERKIDLEYSEFAQAIRDRILQRLGSGNPMSFASTHIIDSTSNIEIWGREISAYPWLRSYIEQQRSILATGGVVRRIFLFEEKWIGSHISEAAKIIAAHDAHFAEFAGRLHTFAYLIRPVDLSMDEAFTILDDVDVFVWHRSRKPELQAFNGGLYITEPTLVRHYIRRWQTLSQDSLVPEIFFSRIQSGDTSKAN
jgi:hypothetical protein